MQKKLLSLVLSLTMAATCFMPVTGVSAKEKADGATPAAGAEAGLADGAEVSFAARVTDEDAPCAADQLIVVYDQNTANRDIRSEAETVGQVADITKTDEQKVALVDLDQNDMAEAAGRMEQGEDVLYVQPNYRYKLIKEEPTGVQTAEQATSSDMKAQEEGSIPDPYLDPENGASYQYQMKTTNAEAAWNEIEANPSHGQTIVGVVDTGVDTRHADLKNNLITQDTQGKYRGYQLGVPVDLYDDTGSHGTHVSGIIGAEYGNGLGGSGIASGHNNDLVKVITTSAAVGEDLFSYDICRAIDYNVAQGARVINMSFGGTGYDVMMERCIRRHYEEDGTVFVAASGNDETNVYSTPCDFSTVIAVNASTERKEAAYFSDYGTFKDIAAPGHNIMSTFPGDQFGMASGTSMASPVVAGICALVLDQNPQLTPAQVRNIICGTTDEAQKGEGFSSDLAYGNIDALAAVKAAAAASAGTGVSSLTIKEDEGIEKTVLKAGEFTALTAHVLPAECLQAVSWSSSDPGVVSVDQTGRLTGIREGRATVTASCGGQTASCEVRVKGGVQPTSVLIKDRDELQEMECLGESAGFGQLMPQVTPAGAVIPEVEFESSDPEVLFLDGPGYYMTKKPGKVTITMRDSDGKVLDSIDVAVKAPVKHIAITSKTKKISVGGTFTFAAKVLEEDAYHPEITWSVSNGKGTIDPETGEFTAKKKGTCYVVAKTENGAHKAVRVTIKGKAKKKNKKADRRSARADRTPLRTRDGVIRASDLLTRDAIRPRLQEDPAEFGQQVIDEIVAEALSVAPVTQQYYSPEVIKAINKTRDDLKAYVREHPDEIQIVWIFIMVSEEIDQQMQTLYNLASLTRDVYKGESDNPELKKMIKREYNHIVRGTKKKHYNDWYWDKFCAMRDSGKAAVGRVHDLDSYLDALQDDLFARFAQQDSYLYRDPYYNSLREYLADNGLDYDSVLSKQMLKSVAGNGQAMLTRKMKRAKNKTGFKPSAGLAKQISQFGKKAGKMKDLQDIVLLHESIMEDWDAAYEAYIEKKTASDPEGPLTNSDRTRVEQKMIDTLYALDHDDYPGDSFNGFWGIYVQHARMLTKCMTHAEVQKVWNKFIKAVEAVPTK